MAVGVRRADRFVLAALSVVEGPVSARAVAVETPEGAVAGVFGYLEGS